MRCLYSTLIFLIIMGCGSSSYTEQSFVFGTLVDIQVYGASSSVSHRAIAQVFQEFDRLHHDFHPWQPGDLMRVNEDLSRQGWSIASLECCKLIQFAQIIENQSQGFFNGALGDILSSWGFYTDMVTGHLPTEDLLSLIRTDQPSLATIDIQYEAEKCVLRSKTGHTRLDFNGLIKGYALDQARDILQKHRIKNALINIGGNVLAMGTRGQEKWRVGIQHPRHPSAFAMVVLDDGEAIGTSGDYQHFFFIDGKRYCHLIDPYTYHPSQHTQSMTVIIPASITANTGLLSDILTKPLFISAANQWQQLRETLNIEFAIRIDEDSSCDLSPAVQKRLFFFSDSMRLNCSVSLDTF